MLLGSVPSLATGSHLVDTKVRVRTIDVQDVGERLSPWRLQGFPKESYITSMEN